MYLLDSTFTPLDDTHNCVNCNSSDLNIKIRPFFQKVYIPASNLIYFKKLKTIKYVKSCPHCGICQPIIVNNNKKYKTLIELVSTYDIAIKNKEELINTIHQIYSKFCKESSAIIDGFKMLSKEAQQEVIKALYTKYNRYSKKFNYNNVNYKKGLTLDNVTTSGNLQLDWSSHAHGFGQCYMYSDENGKLIINSEYMSKEFVINAFTHAVNSAALTHNASEHENILLIQKLNRIKIELADAVIANASIGKINKLKRKINSISYLLENKDNHNDI